MKENIFARVGVLLLVMLAILVSVATISIGNVSRFIATSDWVNKTHAVIREGDKILYSLHAGDAAVRTFLITGDPRDQAAYREAYSEMVERLNVLKALGRSEFKANKSVEQLEPLVSKHIDIARDLVRSRQQGSDDAVKKTLLADAGGESMRKIRKAIDGLQDDQMQLLKTRDKESYSEAQTTRWTVITGLVINFVLISFATFLVRDDIAARRLAANALIEANEQLEAKVKERTADLDNSNQMLRAENLERQWGNKSLEHQLRYSNLIINSINDLVFVLTKTLNITRINPAVASMTGLEAKDLITSPLTRVVRFANDTNGEAKDVFTKALRDGREIQDTAVVVVARDGSTRPYRLNLVPLRDRDKVVGGVVTLRPAVLPQVIA
jgi:PAS domain S-box-containing protein